MPAPLGAVVSAANVNDSIETGAVLNALVVKPPPALRPAAQPDERDLSRSRGDGVYGNRPSKARGGGVSGGGAQARLAAAGCWPD